MTKRFRFQGHESRNPQLKSRALLSCGRPVLISRHHLEATHCEWTQWSTGKSRLLTKHSWTPSVAVLVIQHHHRLQTLFLGNNRVFRRHHNHHPQGNLTKRCVAETRYRRFESCWTGRPANLADSHQIGLIMEIMEQRGYHPLGTHILTLPRLPRSDLK
jgi:hypothetical protein